MQLHKMLLAVLSFFLSISIVFAAPIPTIPHPSFEGGEHITAGNNILIYLAANTPGQLGLRLPLPNGLNLTYGEVLFLGDFYGAADSISEGQSEARRKSRFLAAFNAFADTKKALPEVGKLLEVARQEQIALIDGIKQGKKPEDIYNHISGEINRQYNCITGGGCGSNWYLFPGRFLILASRDLDHFGNSALIAYEVGHKLAIATAIDAHKKNDIQKLKLAYAMNAFASHFLSDRFSAGHIRTPRVKLRDEVTPSVVGSLLAKFMHDEENQYGIYVHNLRGDHWLNFGDKYYFSSGSLETRVKMQEALQESANEIFTAFTTGTIPKETHTALVPYADNSIKNITPLFSWDEETHELFRRVDTTNVYDNNLTTDWWGWSTFVKLSRERGIPGSSQATLALSGLGNEAMKYGLITDSTVIEYIKTR